MGKKFEVFVSVVFFLVVVGVLSDKVTEEVPISVTAGVYWKEVSHAVMYEASIPLVYKSKWPSVDMAYVTLPKANGFCEGSLNDPQCILFSWIFQTDKLVGQRLRWLNESLGIATSSPVLNTPQKYKRSLNFLGNFAHWCCGVVVNRQLRPLFANEKLMSNFEQGLEEQLTAAFSEIDNINLNMKNYSAQVERTFAQIIDVGLNITKVIDRFEKQEFTAEQKNNHKSFSLLQMSAHQVIRQLQTVQLVTRLEIQSQCRERKIPNSVITLEKLKHDLLALARSLNEDGYDLAIPIEEISTYLKIEIADCVISGDEILVNLRIPIRKSESRWKLFEPISVPFAWEDNTCTVQHDVKFLAVDRERLMAIQGGAARECQAYEQQLCYVPRFAGDVVSGSLCPRKMFLGATIQELSNACVFSCVTEKSALVNKVDDFTYVLTHVNMPLILSCRYSVNKTFDVRERKRLGAIEIKVPCDCDLKNENVTLVAESYPCSKQPVISEAVHVVPAPWSKLKSLKISSLQTHASNTFNTFEECLDENWPTQLPHWNLSLTDHSKLETPKLEMLITGRDWFTTLSAVLHVIYMFLVSVMVLRNPYLILGARGLFVRAEATVSTSNNEQFLIDFSCGLILIICFVLGWRLIIRVVNYLRRRLNPTENIELTAKKEVASNDDLPRDMALAMVDGRELRITLEWFEPSADCTVSRAAAD